MLVCTLLEADITTSLTLAQLQSCVLAVAGRLITKQVDKAASGSMIQSLETGKSPRTRFQGVRFSGREVVNHLHIRWPTFSEPGSC